MKSNFYLIAAIAVLWGWFRVYDLLGAGIAHVLAQGAGIAHVLAQL